MSVLCVLCVVQRNGYGCIEVCGVCIECMWVYELERTSRYVCMWVWVCTSVPFVYVYTFFEGNDMCVCFKVKMVCVCVFGRINVCTSVSRDI